MEKKKPTIYELEKILEESPGPVTLAPDGSVHIGPSYEELEQINKDLYRVCKHIEEDGKMFNALDKWTAAFLQEALAKTEGKS